MDSNSGRVTQKEIEELYNEYFDKLYKFFYYKVLSREIAEDLTSDTFITFINIMKEQKEINNIRAFLFGVAKNIFMKYLKQKYREAIPASTLDLDFETYVAEFTEEIDDQKTNEDVLKLFLEKLPEKQRRVVELRLIEKLSLDEICIKLKKDMNYVKTTQKRALKNLKKAVELGEVDEEDKS